MKTNSNKKLWGVFFRESSPEYCYVPIQNNIKTNVPGIFLKNTFNKKEDILKELTSFKRLFGYFWLLFKLQLSRVMYNTFATCCRSIADNT